MTLGHMHPSVCSAELALTHTPMLTFTARTAASLTPGAYAPRLTIRVALVHWALKYNDYITI
jgi:hypothetical protein